MQKLAEKIGLSSMIQNFKTCNINHSKKVATGKMTITTTTITTSTPKKETTCDNHGGDSLLISNCMLPAIEESPEKKLENATKACQEDDIDDEVDAADTSKFGDSGLDTMVCDDSNDMSNEQLLRACSCQSIVDDATMNACDDVADLDDYDTSENITSISLDEPSKSESINNITPVPLQANAHLYCHTSNLQLDLDDTSIDQKTQKYVLIKKIWLLFDFVDF
jgi:hypothetical protein